SSDRNSTIDASVALARTPHELRHPRFAQYGSRNTNEHLVARPRRDWNRRHDLRQQPRSDETGLSAPLPSANQVQRFVDTSKEHGPNSPAALPRHRRSSKGAKIRYATPNFGESRLVARCAPPS